MSEVIAVEEQQTGADAAAFTITDLFRRSGVHAPLTWTGNIPVRLSRVLEAAGFDVVHLLSSMSRHDAGDTPGSDR